MSRARVLTLVISSLANGVELSLANSVLAEATRATSRENTISAAVVAGKSEGDLLDCNDIQWIRVFTLVLPSPANGIELSLANSVSAEATRATSRENTISAAVAAGI